MDQKGTLLIGGNGFIGQVLVPELKKRNKPIYVLARNLDHLENKVAVSLYSGSLDNVQILNDLLPCCDEIVYLASNTTPGTSQGAPLFEFDTNVRPLLKFIQCLQDYSDIHLVYISSGGSVYGNQEQLPIAEDAFMKPMSYHASGKVAAEAMLSAYSQYTDNPVTILRPSNVYGPGQPGSPQFGLIPKLLSSAYSDETTDIWGDGENIRDYLFIEDFVDAASRILEHKERLSLCRTYNIGSGVGYTINQVCQIVEQVTSVYCKKCYLDTRKVDVREIILDISRIQKEISWMPRTGLVEGIGKTWNWFLEQKQYGR